MNVVLLGLEISLRTNPLTWVQEFLAYQDPDPEREKLPHGGLDVLLNYFKNIDEEGKCVVIAYGFSLNACGIGRTTMSICASCAFEPS